MVRRRWRFVTIAAFLLFIMKDTQCQDENDFYYTPVERSFAQVQPPLFPSRSPSFYEQGDSYRVAPPAHQPLYNEGFVRFPSPNYNQNPSPFQLPTGRSQSGGQYYVNQPDFTPQQRQKYRPSLPHNYQIVHPASTKKPNTSQIHSAAYQNDPSKPEAFLGQITINNPDIDYLQNTRFKNIPFDGNSLKSNGQSGHIAHDEDVDSDNQDLFDHHRVTTYNPNKLVPKIRPNIKPNAVRFIHYETLPNENAEFGNAPEKTFTRNNKITLQNSETPSRHGSSTEYKELLDLEPLLEEDISEVNFRELMKNSQGSFDVQVIKSNYTKELNTADDSEPDATSMNADNMQKEISAKVLPSKNGRAPLPTTTSVPQITDQSHTNHEYNGSEEVQDDADYEDVYYDEPESGEENYVTKAPTSTVKIKTDLYDEYDVTEEPENSTDETSTNVTQSFDILVMKQNNKTMVKDDNFKHFTDTTVIDQTEDLLNNDTAGLNNNMTSSEEDVTSIETPSILGQEVVSVVTTKSVVNGTISIPDVTFAPSTKKFGIVTESSFMDNDTDTSIPVTTENWVVVASVQTSRSVSGARFLPFLTVEQEEKKQVLTDVEDEDDLVTQDPRKQSSGLTSSSSTENINDKLDSIQSELSSAVLSGSLDKGNKNIELITEATTELITSTPATTTTTTSPLNIFTLKSTAVPIVTEKSSPEPLPVLIKKFTPRVATSTTPKPKKKPSLVTVMDDLAGLLPPGYKPRLSYKDKRTSTTTSTSTTTTLAPFSNSEEPFVDNTQGRSSGISSKNKVILLDSKSLLPQEYKPKEEKSQEDMLKKVPKDKLDHNLPPDYKFPATEETIDSKSRLLDKLPKVQEVDISAFLPKDFKLNPPNDTSKNELPIKPQPVDITSILPPGFKLNDTADRKGDPSHETETIDVLELLPPGYKLNNTDETAAYSSTTKAPGGIKLVFPSRPGNKAVRKTTPRPAGESGPSPITPKIHKGWPVRASTEFTGWPTPSTTPFSIEKLLEAQRNATATSPAPEFSTEASTRRAPTTTSTTPAPPPPTTPGVCQHECDIAATIKIVSGVNWVPELLDHHTEEWQRLAEDVKDALNSVYSKSNPLKKWYKGIRIDGFSKGSVLVDYFIELNEVEKRVDTLELKKLFHKSLHEVDPGSVVETVTEEMEQFDVDTMLGDQPDEERMKKSNEKMTKTIDKSAGKLEIGKFVMDPAYTEFIVLPKREQPTLVPQDEESILPQWGIAVIVIAMASLLFVIIFGVTVLVNRQKSAKAKQPIPLSEDMLRELDKSHMGGYDDMHQMKERDLPYLPSGKRLSTAFIEQLAYPAPGDSWRSEWTPQLQKYMQHYTPDSGRGSQTYGAAGNGYGYGGGSQIYGQTGGGSQIYGQTGGGSQAHGYTGEHPPRSHYSRRRSDYDSNF